MTYNQGISITNTDLPDIVELRNINITYDGGKNFIIKDLNFLVEDKINQGQFAVILGLSGCGKSSLLRLISGLQRPTSGEIFIKGKPKSDAIRIGMVFQQYSSFPWLSVLDNVALGLQYKGVPKKERYEKAMEIIKMVGLEGHEKKYAKYPTLSGGQLQRIAIARSLVADPEILLLDEPFGALDLNTRLQMQDLLCEIWTKLQSTIIFVTHDLPEAVYLGDDIYIMRACPGKIVEKIKVDLPLERNRSIKHSTKFMEIVHNVECRMIAIQNFMDEEKKKAV
jgi:NitT/TauT family transport system ATP-binding protein